MNWIWLDKCSIHNKTKCTATLFPFLSQILWEIQNQKLYLCFDQYVRKILFVKLGAPIWVRVSHISFVDGANQLMATRSTTADNILLLEIPKNGERKTFWLERYLLWGGGGWGVLSSGGRDFISQTVYHIITLVLWTAHPFATKNSSRLNLASKKCSRPHKQKLCSIFTTHYH